jgi:signal transduction histidine kinase
MTLVRVAVHDTGGGIRASDLDRVFSAFFTTTPGGMGVGLVDQPLDHQAHDGRLWTTPQRVARSDLPISLPAA